LLTNQLPIGVFDSGLGGLTGWYQLRQHLPHESFLYFGDTARVPYGTRTPSEIYHFVREIITWMSGYPVKMIVMACNTSSALALDLVRAESPVPILGLILPGAAAAVAHGSRIGVLATPATVSSHAYQQAITERGLASGRTIMCWEQSCPEFVPLIESKQIHSPRLRQVAQDYLQPLLDQRIDTLVYGCTHYPLLDPILRPLLPSEITVVDPAIALAKAVAQELDLWGLRCTEEAQSLSDLWERTIFSVSGDPEDFAQKSMIWLGRKPLVTQVKLLQYTDQPSV
jgi:glutamate racemase